MAEAPGGWIFDLQRGALHDGPGVRTTVFLQGCPLRCAWCHNPESWTAPPAGARWAAVEEVVAVVRRDARYHGPPDAEGNRGGLTVSGGEPTLQAGFCRDLLAAARGEGFHTCLDTSGAFPVARLGEWLPHVDLWLLDYKATDAPEDWLGLPEAPLARAREALLASGAAVRLRCPLIPGLNDTPAHLAAIAALSHRVRGVDLMPFHRMGAHKFAACGMPDPLAGRPSATPDDLARWREALARLGAVRVVEG